MSSLPMLGTALLVGAAVLGLFALHKDFGPSNLTRQAGGFIVLTFMAFTISPGGINVLYALGACGVLLVMLYNMFGFSHQE